MGEQTVTSAQAAEDRNFEVIHELWKIDHEIDQEKIDKLFAKFKKKYPVSGQGDGRSALILPDGHYVRIHSYQHGKTLNAMGISSFMFMEMGGMSVSCLGENICVDVLFHLTQAMMDSLAALMRRYNYYDWSIYSKHKDESGKPEHGCVKPYHIKEAFLKHVKESKKVTTDIKAEEGYVAVTL